MRWAKVPTVGAGLKSYLSSGKSSAMAMSLRPISFHCSRTAPAALDAGFGAASFFGMSWERAGVTKIVAAKIATASARMLFNFIGFIVDSSSRCYGACYRNFRDAKNIFRRGAYRARSDCGSDATLLDKRYAVPRILI